ncbi:TlpA disulfide reductase family protein [Flavobacterium sp.]|uniref:TlpA family protein disulfide reductase n=1 Tax=Flavobacterium sp. TaxID=239 RepID=UPI00261E5D17|nr:TlpA disulfide reductase family protein [Flavobacterium sp.]MDD3003910.1 TlpA disulfide reductase family protein [Flavobacterium sp.]
MKKLALLFLFAITTASAQKELPNINLKSLENKSINVKSDFTENDKIYVYIFWATWCAPCIQELDAINDVYTDWKNELNMEIIAVSIDDARTGKRVKPMVNGRSWEYTILLDTNQDLKRSLSIANPPYTIVVKNGKILSEQAGHAPGSENEFFQKLKSY